MAGRRAGWPSAAARARPRRRRSGGSGRPAAHWAAAPTRVEHRRSSSLAGGSAVEPRGDATRQVEQRPRPPQTEACGMPADRLASRIVRARLDLDALPGRIADGDRAVTDEPAPRAAGEPASPPGPRQIRSGTSVRWRRERRPRPGPGNRSAPLRPRARRHPGPAAGDLAAAGDKAEQCHHRHQKSAGIGNGRPRGYHGLESQPEVQADAAMQPRRRPERPPAAAR